MCENLVPGDPLAVVMAIEQKFGIIILDEEAEKIATMGELYDFVLARVARGQEQVCVTSAAFYQLRRALGEACHVPRERVQTETRLEHLVPVDDRPRYWREMQARLRDLRLPRLCLPRRLAQLIEVISLIPLVFACLATIVLAASLERGPVAGIVVGLAVLACPLVGSIGMILVCRIACQRTEKYAVEIPSSCATIRDTVYALIGNHAGSPLVSATTRASDKEIWRTLCTIVGREFDRSPDSFTRASKII
jgi:hypothetical protein